MGEKERIREIYDEWRTAQLNVYYYGHRRRDVRRYDMGGELVVAVLSLGVVGSVLSRTTMQWIPVMCAVVTAAVPIIRKSMRVSERLDAYDASIRGYRVLAFDLKKLASAIAIDRGLSEVVKQRFSEAMERRRQLVGGEWEEVANEALAKQCQARVNREVPPEDLFVPEGGN